MSDRPTPETDAACWRSGLQGHGTVDDCDPELCHADFARKLERERDEAQRACQLAHDRLLRGDNDREILDILAKGWRAAK